MRGMGFAPLALALAASTASETRFEALSRAQGGPVALAPREASPSSIGAIPERTPDPVLDERLARAVVREHRASLWACRDRAEGEKDYVLLLAVRSNGRVTDLRLEPEPSAGPELSACFRRAVLRWRFPRFSGERGDGRTVEVTNLSIPITFAPAGADDSR